MDLLDRMYRDGWKAEPWALNAENLRTAAGILLSAYEASMAEDGEPIAPDEMRMNEPATLLYGYAMENAIKSYLIAERKLDAELSRKVPGWTDHDLGKLLQETRTPASVEQKMLLGTLSAHIVWAGKYPVAFQFKKSGHKSFVLANQFEAKPFNVCENEPPRTFNRSLMSELDKLFNRLLEKTRGKLQNDVQERESPGSGGIGPNVAREAGAQF